MSGMRNKLLRLGCLILIFLHGSCLDIKYEFEPALKVTSGRLSSSGYLPSAITKIGVPDYGGTLIGTVVYPEANHMACHRFGDYNISFKSKPGSLPVVVLVHLGDCSISRKVLNAQEAGASAALIMDEIERSLRLTLSAPGEGCGSDSLMGLQVRIPSALIHKSFGEKMKADLDRGEMVNINLALPESSDKGHPSVPDEAQPVKYQLWINANLDCDRNCKSQIEFIKNFSEVAKMLEVKGYAHFTPHYITWKCPESLISRSYCNYHCINNGRYCAPGLQHWGPSSIRSITNKGKIVMIETKGETDVSIEEHGRNRVTIQYSEKEVVVQSLLQACFFKMASEIGKPWLWWDFVAEFATHCTLTRRNYNKQCTDDIVSFLGVDLDKVYNCMGDPDIDAYNPILEAEQDFRAGKISHGREVAILPTLVINDNEYRGKLASKEVLKAICREMQMKEKPLICSEKDVEVGIWL